MSENEHGGPPKPPGGEPEDSGAFGGTPPEIPPSSESPPPPESPPAGPPPSQPPAAGPDAGAASGDAERSAAMWAHLGGAIITILCVCAPLAFVPPLIFFLTNKDKSRYASFHSLQALFLFGATSLINLVLGMAGLVGLFVLTAPVAMIVNLAAGIYGIFIGMQANKGEWAEYVFLGQLAKDQLKQ